MELLEIGYFNTKLLQLSTSSSLNIHSSIFQCPSTIQAVIAHINSKLNVPASRFEGLLVLKTILPQCTDEVFIDNGLSWMQQCLKAGDVQVQTETSTLAYQVLKMLLETSRQLPEMTKQISNVVVPKLNGQVQRVPKESILAALQCTEVVLSSYGGACGPSKVGLEKLLVQFADQGNDLEVVDVAARCMAILPLVGGGGTQGVNHKNQWSEAQLSLCNTLHHLLDQLFENVDEIQSYSSAGGQMLQVPLITDINAVAKTRKLNTRLCNVAKFLQAMLVGVSPVGKCVVPDMILNIVCRGLAVTCHTLGHKSTADMLVLGSALPHIHTALLGTVDALIACCGRNLLPYGPVICKLVLQSLKWTSTDKWAYGAERPYQALRVAACSTLVAWLTVAKAASCVELTAEQLVGVLTQDVRVLRPAVTLSAQGRRSKLLSKKQQRKQHQQSGSVEEETKGEAVDMRGVRSKLLDPTANSAICEAALGALESLLQAASSSIKPTLHKLLQEITVMLLMDLQRSNRSSDTVVPYSVAKCRLGLYRLLYSLTMEPHPTWPPPTQHALQLFAAGQRDPNILVSGYCTLALSGVEKLLHPTRPTMYFPLIVGELDRATAVVDVDDDLQQQECELEADQQSGDEVMLEPPLERGPGVEAHPDSDKQVQTNLDVDHEVVMDSDSGHKVVTDSVPGHEVNVDHDDLIHLDSNNDLEILYNSGDKVEVIPDSGHEAVPLSESVPEVETLPVPQDESCTDTVPAAGTCPDSGPQVEPGPEVEVISQEIEPDPEVEVISQEIEPDPEVEVISQEIKPDPNSSSQGVKRPDSDDDVVELLDEPSAKRIKLNPEEASLANGDVATLVNGDANKPSQDELDEEEMLKAFHDVLKE